MERFIKEISNYMDSEPADVMDRIKALPKPEDLTDLQARMDCLLKENVELRAKADEGDALQTENKELKDRMKEAEKEAKAARTERDRSKEIAQKVSKFLGSPGDVLNKARLFDHGLKQPATDSGVKMMHCMIDYTRRWRRHSRSCAPFSSQPEANRNRQGRPEQGPAPPPPQLPTL